MKTGVIILKYGNTQVPESYLKLALGQSDTFLGVSFVNKEDKKPPRLMRVANVDDVSLERFNSGQKAFEDTILVSYLGQASEDIPACNYQPFTALSDKDNTPLIYAYLDGSFIGYNRPKEVASEQANVVSKYLAPKLDAMYKNVGYDMAKLLPLLEDDMFKLDLKNTMTGRGCIVLQCVTGNMFMVENENLLSQEFPWGWVSNTYGYAEGAAAPKVEPAQEDTVVAETDRLAAAFGTASLQKAGPTSNVATRQPEPEPEPQKETPGYVAFGSKKVEAPAVEPATVLNAGTVVTKEEIVWVFPPANVHGKQGLKTWYRRWGVKGDHPQNWKERPSWPVLAVQVADSKGSLDKSKTGEKGTPVVAAAAAETVAAKPFINALSPDKAPENVQEHKVPASEPMFSDEEKQKVKLFTQKHKLDLRSKPVLSAAEIQAKEDKYPSFCDAFGMDGLEVPLGWSMEVYEDFCATNPKAAAYLMASFGNEYGKLLGLLDEMTTKHVAPAEPAKTEPAKVEPTPEPRKVAFGSMR